MVTGAAGDIGGVAAVRLAQKGATVVVADHPRSADRLDATVEACRQANPDAVVRQVVFDVTSSADTKEALEAAAATSGPFHLVFNNAGVQGAFTPTHRYPTDDAASVIAVNVTGALNVLIACSAIMSESGTGGAIVNMASMAGVTGAPNMVAYSASKAAIIGMTKSAAKDLAPRGIRVNCISPAFIGPGAMWERQVELQAAAGTQYFPPDPDLVAEAMIGSIPMRRYGSIDEVVDVVMWLLSDQSSYVTGENVQISGGSA